VTASTVAYRYAAALLDLALERGDANQVGEDLTKVAAALEASGELQVVLSNPAIRRQERLGVVTALASKLGLGGTATTFLKLVVEKGRASAIAQMVEAYRERHDAQSGRVQAEVISARALAESDLESLRQKLEATTGKSVTINSRIDPDILGGVITRVGSKVFDGSVRGRLEALKDRLIRETA